MNEAFYKQNAGAYLIELPELKAGAAFAILYERVIEQFIEKGVELDLDNALVCMTLKEMEVMADKHPELETLVFNLMNICPAFHGFYDDVEGVNRKKMYQHCLIAVFENYFAAVIDNNDPGYIVERLLNFGSNSIWEHLQVPPTTIKNGMGDRRS